MTNISNFSTATSLPQWIPLINDATSGWFGIMTLITIYLVCFAAGKMYNNQTAFIFAGAITLFTSLIFWTMGAVSFMVFATVLVVAALSVAVPFLMQY